MDERPGPTITDRAEILSAPNVVRLTTEEVASALGLAPATLRKWAWTKPDGALLPIVKKGRRNLYSPSDVRRWLGVAEPGPERSAA